MHRQTTFIAQCKTCKYYDCVATLNCDDCPLYNEYKAICNCVCEPYSDERECSMYEPKPSDEDSYDAESYYNIRKED